MSEDEREDGLPEAPKARGQGKIAWVGLFLVVGVIGVLGVLFVMTDAAIFRGRYVVTSQVPDAGGIRRGDPVQMRGVNIGRVLRFKIGPTGVAIQLEIEGEYEIPSDSRVALRSAGPLQGMVAEVVPGTSERPLAYGETLPGSSGTALGDTVDEISGKTQAVLDRLRDLLSQETVDGVRGSTSELRDLIGELSAAVKEQRGDLRALTRSLREASEGLDRSLSGPELERAVKRLDGLTERLDGVAEGLESSSRSVEVVLGRIERGEGTLGRLSKDDALYENLNQAAASISQASHNVNKLTEEIRRNPRRYLKLSVF